MKAHLRWISLACVILTTGCGLDGPVPRKPQTEAAAPAGPSAEPKTAETEKAPTRKRAAQEAGAEKENTERPTVEHSTTEQGAPGTVREKAQVGMGEKGRGYGGGVAGIITTPIHVMFTAQETITLQRIDEAMKYYRAEHDGQAPKTKDEFMDKIIKANSIRLPTLPQGESYVYDPKTGDLLVQKPANN